MREIKFRAWDGERIKEVTGVGWIDNEIDYIMTPKYSGPASDFKLMQYTGLKDKNGKEIYEGDVIKYVYRKPMLPELYVVKDMTNYHDMRILEKIISKPLSAIEVIGNIYENPELLEVKK